MDKKVIIVGAFHEMIELCQDLSYEIVGLVDNDKKGSYYNIPIIGTDDDASILFNTYADIPLVITPDNPNIREKLFNLYSKIGYKFQTLISNTSKISPTVKIGIGTIIQHGVNVSSNTVIGDFVKLNTNANVMHDCVINNFATVAPNAVILGCVNIEQNAYIGANSTILPNLHIGVNTVVGAASVVTKNISDNITVKGNPAK